MAFEQIEQHTTVDLRHHLEFYRTYKVIVLNKVTVNSVSRHEGTHHYNLKNNSAYLRLLWYKTDTPDAKHQPVTEIYHLIPDSTTWMTGGIRLAMSGLV